MACTNNTICALCVGTTWGHTTAGTTGGSTAAGTVSAEAGASLVEDQTVAQAQYSSAGTNPLSPYIIRGHSVQILTLPLNQGYVSSYNDPLSRMSEWTEGECVCVCCFVLWPNIGESLSLRSRGFLTSEPRGHAPTIQVQNLLRTSSTCLPQTTSGGRILTLHLNYVAGYTSPLLFLFKQAHNYLLTTKGFYPRGSVVWASPKIVRPHW